MSKISTREEYALKQLKVNKRREKIQEWTRNILTISIFLSVAFLLIVMLSCSSTAVQKQYQHCAPVYDTEGKKTYKVLCADSQGMLYKVN